MAEAEALAAAEGLPPKIADLGIAHGHPHTSKATEQKIDPWSVEAGRDEHGNEKAFDYEAIAKTWNTQLIDQALLDRFEQVTGKKPHRWLRRGLYFSHRDFNMILDAYERGEPFLLYTGRGPSSDSMHLGHAIPFAFTKWLQDVFDCPLVIMLTDDEKALFKDSLSVEDVMKFARENAKDIIAMGFDEKKTFIYQDTKYFSGHFYWNALEFSKLVTFNQVRGAFGFNESTNIGRIFFPSLQCVAAFANSYPEIWGDDPNADQRSKRTARIRCLIPMAIDQLAPPKPALVHTKFLTSLLGPAGKMSASNPNSKIDMSDTPKQIQKKINSHAFSGGQETIELHRELGGNPDVDVAYQYLTYFDDDDDKLAKFYRDYKSGVMSTGEMKKECIAVVQAFVKEFQERRAQVTDEVLKRYMTPRKLEWKGNPNPKKPPPKPQDQPKSKSKSKPQPETNGEKA